MYECFEEKALLKELLLELLNIGKRVLLSMTTEHRVLHLLMEVCHACAHTETEHVVNDSLHRYTPAENTPSQSETGVLASASHGHGIYWKTLFVS